jgi:hypothetical protein
VKAGIMTAVLLALVWGVALWAALGCAYSHSPTLGTTWAIGDAVATSTGKTCKADGGMISDNARLAIAEAVAAGVRAAVGGGIPAIPDLTPGESITTPVPPSGEAAPP